MESTVTLQLAGGGGSHLGSAHGGAGTLKEDFNRSMEEETLHYEGDAATWVSPASPGGIISSTRIPVASSDSQTNSGVLQLAGSSNRRLDGLSSAEGSNDDGRRGTMDGELGNATISKVTDNGVGGEQTSRATLEGGSRNRPHGLEKTTLNGTAKRIHFEESEEA
jgi:hypothetical protein